MKAASHVPSGVLISTSVSTTSRPAAMADPAVTPRPAATEKVTKSRRARSPGCESFFFWFFWSSVMVVLSKECSDVESILQYWKRWPLVTERLPRLGGLRSKRSTCSLISARIPPRRHQRATLYRTHYTELAGGVAGQRL